ncbi:TRAF-type zinc finger domain-containing protein 1-like isoform X2 [Anthonomus grandis grandis]|uniref:TRAF-type zinc finger domain-containing protein 1-like isoform X2 n=1 Tax=Anthonomus grandis grandis TaxID=2921223 RepID=UPI00216654DB|nr:TRAF-type zinc finger domain-containing protein 1-like isoform X2 [Anthonomus grandis grandis]
MDANVEMEMCNNCKKEIPQPNYVMHTMHCARNITLCKVCQEPIPKIEYETHREKCKRAAKKPSPPPIALEQSNYFQQRKAVEEKKIASRRERYLKSHEHLVDDGFTLRESVTNGYDQNTSSNAATSIATHSRKLNNLSMKKEVKSNVTNIQATVKNSEKSAPSQGGAVKKPPLIPRLDDVAGPKPKGPQGLLSCRYCDLELPKLDLEEHENYCGSRTDKCLECGELVMFKNKQVHLDSNHGFVKLKDEPGPRPSWDSASQRSSMSDIESSRNTRRRLERLRLNDVDYDPMPYLPAAYQPGGGLSRKKKDGESYKEISRRLDCPAPQPPRRRRNPPTELTIPCEFCDTPIPHEELIEHETGCRPDLCRFNSRRSRSSVPLPDEDDYTPYEAPRMRSPPRADSPDSEELPCEFCANMVPASQLWRHQLSCTSAA